MQTEVPILFDLVRPNRATVKIFNLRGDTIRLLITDRIFESGSHKIYWDRKDNDGKLVQSGQYFFQIEADEFSITKKISI